MTTDNKDQDKTRLEQSEENLYPDVESSQVDSDSTDGKTDDSKPLTDQAELAELDNGEGERSEIGATIGESSELEEEESLKPAVKKPNKPGKDTGVRSSIPQANKGVSSADTATTVQGGEPRQDEASSSKVGEYQPRQISLVVSRIDPWTVMKVSFLLSVALGIAMVLAGLLVWLMLNSMNVFSSVENFINDIDPTGSIASMIDYLRLPRVMAMSTIIAVSNVILVTAFCTVGALIYNLATSLVGGVKLSLTDE